MDDGNPKPMRSYDPTIHTRSSQCYIDAGMLERDDIAYGSVNGDSLGTSNGSPTTSQCFKGGVDSGLVVAQDLGLIEPESHHFRLGCQAQQTLSSMQQRQHLQQQQQQQADVGSVPARTLGSASPKPIRRRMRMITSCLECRRRKLKCNKSNPCTNCLRFSRDCFYLGPKLDEASQLRLTEIKEKVGSLERQLERDVAKSGGRGYYPQRILADDVDEDREEERDLEITPMVALDLTYEDDADGMDDIMDLGVQVGKMRLTEKIGGLNRPRISEEIQTGLSGGVAPQPFSGGAVPGLDIGTLSQPDLYPASASSGQSMPDFLRPSDSYIPPTSGVFFGQIVQPPSLLSFLPSRSAGDRLLEHYFEAVHPVARCVHKPSLEAQHEGFWDEATAGYEPRASIQAIVFAAWFSAAVALDEATITREFGFTKANLVENMKVGTEVALSKANFLRTTRVDTMQAFVMYMIPLCRDEVSRAHSVLVGAAVRMAECMGLNRDGSKAYNLNPLETHTRRLIWHQLCFLDIRTCEAQGPKPAIRREDYDTWLPENFEEDQLINDAYSARPCEGWTSTLLPLIRFEINEMMRTIWADRRKLESRKTTLTQVLFKIEKFRKRMLENYDRLLNERVPIQRYAKLVMHLLMYRLHVMVLHPYYANTANPMPQRLRSVLVMSATVIIELAMQLDTNPAFQLWRWYGGAYQQYQAALILATEMFYHPSHKDAIRIWACLDYVFSLEGSMPTEEKGRQVLAEIMGKMGVYMSLRKTRAPTATASASPAKQAVKAEKNNDDGDDDDDDDDDVAAIAAAAVLARAGMENSSTSNGMHPAYSPTFEQHPSGVGYHHYAPPSQQAHHKVIDRAAVMMKQEPGAISPVTPGPPVTSSVGTFPIMGTTTPSAVHPFNCPHPHIHQSQHQQRAPGSAPTIASPTPLAHQVGVNPNNSNIMATAMLPATGPTVTTTTGGSDSTLWSLSQTVQPPLNNHYNNNSPESPEDASLTSDGGSVVGPGLGRHHHHHHHHHHRHVGGTASMASGGAAGSSVSGLSGPLSSGATQLLDGGDWSNYQEDAINALFPYDLRTGSFTGFGHPMAGRMNTVNGSSWRQDEHSGQL